MIGSAHAGRIWTLGTNTFTQLVRMKVFYFMGLFALVVLGSNFFNLPQHGLPETIGFTVLRAIKGWSLGAMTLFSLLVGTVATALLLPRDVEDRTLYTILAKPVPRIDYLIGKLLGVLLLLAVSLALMDLLMLAVLHVRVAGFENDINGFAAVPGADAGAVARMRAELAANGPNASLQGAVFAVWLRSAVLVALTLFISTFASSTLFTTIVSFVVYFLGNMQADLRQVFLHPAGLGIGLWEKVGAFVLALLLPDFQQFNIIDAVIEGAAAPLSALGWLAGLAAFHIAVYVTAAWYIFSGKEV